MAAKDAREEALHVLEMMAAVSQNEDDDDDDNDESVRAGEVTAKVGQLMFFITVVACNM